MNPKRPGCCSLCDKRLREVKEEFADGTPKRMGKRLPGSRVATLVHLDGAHSDHSLCATCEVKPESLPTLWRRVCMAYAAQITKPHPSHERYARNVPLAIVAHRELDR